MADPNAATATQLRNIETRTGRTLAQVRQLITASGLERHGELRTPYVSLRRRKQFAMLGPATKDQLELGLNVQGLPSDARLKALPAGGMCQYAVRLSSAAEIDATLLGWLRSAFDAAG